MGLKSPVTQRRYAPGEVTRRAPGSTATSGRGRAAALHLSTEANTLTSSAEQARGGRG